MTPDKYVFGMSADDSLTPPAGPPDPANDWWWMTGTSAVSAAGIVVTDDAALQLDAVQSILTQISGTVSTLPLMVFRKTGTDTKVPVPDHPLYKVLADRPNDEQTPQEFWQELTIHLLFWRNFYGLIRPGADYAIGAIDQIHPTRLVKIERRADGRRYYTFNRLAPSIGNDTYRDDEIWHIRLPRLTKDGLRGLTMVEAARDTFGRAIAVEQFGALYFKNGGSGGGHYEHPGKFSSKEDKQDFLDTMRSQGTGLNRHKDRLLMYGVKYNPNKVENDEAQFIETLKETSIKLCRLWGMPPHKIGILDKATLNNIAQQATEYVTGAVMPPVTAIEQGAKRDLLVGADADSYVIEFNLGGVLRGDFTTRNSGYVFGRQWGWYSVNDIRRMEGLAPIGEAGDIYLMPLNMRNAEDPAPDTDPPAPGKDPDPEDPKDPEDAD